jgi:hypothetical protein
MALIIRKTVEDIARATLHGQTINESLKRHKISPLEFWKHLEKYPDDALLFQTARIALIENEVSGMALYIEGAQDKFELDKAIAKNSVTKWLAEKIIPKTYGQKMQVEQHVSIDIKGVLARIDSVIEVSKSPLYIEKKIDDAITIDKEIDKEMQNPATLLGEESSGIV